MLTIIPCVLYFHSFSTGEQFLCGPFLSTYNIKELVQLMLEDQNRTEINRRLVRGTFPHFFV